jgi:putative transposase
MKKTRYSNEQIVTILRDADAHGAEAAAKKSGVSVASIYAWRKRFGSMDVNDVKRLRELEAENGKLKKLLADRLLEIDILKEFNAKKW